MAINVTLTIQAQGDGDHAGFQQKVSQEFPVSKPEHFDAVLAHLTNAMTQLGEASRAAKAKGGKKGRD